uniref:Uncharacterized protein n=1 Tax=Chromera velia CCMP2878 TaxID=1169474 RepID=A0A0G4I3U9_9ALVE|eukprot:Cvel_10767.t1-p1 / transcript=Cvel_10767.t1 / gene=Cvel_10767 / organism=Chromera_velia_CCMP2878 / gene_product=hypothetical protein / transcript_product=hypothetical protein / location=Cvel_scaffold657:54604-57466(-) / protein_length=414 / sequence_SO=supercontig / SO=protein_coding / is_pseudo=false
MSVAAFAQHEPQGNPLPYAATTAQSMSTSETDATTNKSPDELSGIQLLYTLSKEIEQDSVEIQQLLSFLEQADGDCPFEAKEALALAIHHMDLHLVDIPGLFLWVSRTLGEMDANTLPAPLEECHSCLCTMLSREETKMKAVAAVCSSSHLKNITPRQTTSLLQHFIGKALKTYSKVYTGEREVRSPTVGSGGPRTPSRQADEDMGVGMGDCAGAAAAAASGASRGTPTPERVALRKRKPNPFTTGPQASYLVGKSRLPPPDEEEDDEDFGDGDGEDVGEEDGSSGGKGQGAGVRKKKRGSPLTAQVGMAQTAVEAAGGFTGDALTGFEMTDEDLAKLHIGESGRAQLKSLISQKCRAQPELKARILELGQVKYARLHDLLKMARACNLWPEVLRLHHLHITRPKASVNRRMRP